MEEQSQQVEQLAGRVFCPICGDTMHQVEMLGELYWECDDPSCGFIEPV